MKPAGGRPECRGSRDAHFEDEASLTALRTALHRGRPLGSDRFVAKLEHALGRRLRPLPVGRPRKRVKAGAAKNRGENE